MRHDDEIVAARETGDLTRWTEAVLTAASAQEFGTEPGRLPAELYDVLIRTTDDADRARVAAALARCWAYSGRADRAVPFADEAVDRAIRVNRPELLADCLDSALAAHWGPDELQLRASLAGRLDDVTAHVLDPLARLQAHLWGLQVACELLDVQGILRQLRALDVLAEESPRARFFAETRRFMYDLLRGRNDALDGRIAAARSAEPDANLTDGWMVIASARGYGAWQTGDAATAAEIADLCEQFALREGSATTIAEAAVFWMGADRPDRAGALVHLFRGRHLDDLPRDVNWLLTLQCLLEAAPLVARQTARSSAGRTQPLPPNRRRRVDDRLRTDASAEGIRLPAPIAVLSGDRGGRARIGSVGRHHRSGTHRADRPAGAGRIPQPHSRPRRRTGRST